MLSVGIRSLGIKSLRHFERSKFNFSFCFCFSFNTLSTISSFNQQVFFVSVERYVVWQRHWHILLSSHRPCLMFLEAPRLTVKKHLADRHLPYIHNVWFSWQVYLSFVCLYVCMFMCVCVCVCVCVSFGRVIFDQKSRTLILSRV